MSKVALVTADWDRPIRGQSTPARASRPTILKDAPTVEQAINAWIASRPYARSTARRIHEHLESKRACGWREQRGIVTIDQLTAAEAAEYVLYLRDRGGGASNAAKGQVPLLEPGAVLR